MFTPSQSQSLRSQCYKITFFVIAIGTYIEIHIGMKKNHVFHSIHCYFCHFTGYSLYVM
jgi:hypothetical protein